MTHTVRCSYFTASLTALMLVLAAAGPANAQSGPLGVTIQGRILDNTSVPVEGNPIQFTLQVRSPGVENCLLYEETHSINMANSDGVFTLTLGSGVRTGANYEHTSTLSQVVTNSAGAFNSLTCAVGSSYTPGSTHSRKLQLSFNAGGGTETISELLTLDAVPYALYANTLQGKGSTDFIQVSVSGAAVTQSNLNTVFSSNANATELAALAGLTSTNYVRANGANFTPSASVSYNSQRITNLANPTAAQDAATKNYCDANIGSKSIDLAAVGAGTGNGRILSWDATNNRWTTTTATGDGLGNHTASQNILLGSNWLSGDGGNEGIRVDANGNIGVGTAAPAKRLHVYSGSSGDGINIDGTSNPALTISHGGTNKAFLGMATDPNQFAPGSAVEDLVLRTQTQNFLISTDAGTTTAFKINTSGHVGIGTTNPNQPLLITKDGYNFAGSWRSVANFDNGAFTKGVMLGYDDNTTTGFVAADTSAGVSSSLAFLTAASGTHSEKMRITGVGYVGVGTTAPAEQIHVLSPGSVNAILRLETPGGTDASVIVDPFPGGGAKAWDIGAKSTGYFYIYDRFNARSPFRIDQGASADSIRILATGNVGVGTAAPGEKLEVGGAVKIGNAANTADGTIRWTGTDFEGRKGGAWVSMTGVGGSSGTVTNVTSANSYLSVSNGATTPALTLNVGTAANTVAAGNDSRITGAHQTSTSLGGDLGGTLPNPTVAKIQGQAVHTTTPSATASGQVLRWDHANSRYDVAFLSLADIRSTITAANTMFPATSCTAAQALTWSSLTDTMTCSNIAIASGAVSGLGTAATLNVGTGANNIVQLDGSSRLPAVDGSLLTGIPGASFPMLSSSNGSASAPAYSFAGDPDNGMWKPNTNLLALSTAGSERVRIDASGNVGVGTTAPAYKLDVAGDINGESLRMSGARIATYGSNLVYLGDVGGNLADVGLFANGVEKVRILQNGNVGVGTTTPNAKLEVNGGIQALASGGFTLQFAVNDAFNIEAYGESTRLKSESGATNNVVVPLIVEGKPYGGIPSVGAGTAISLKNSTSTQPNREMAKIGAAWTAAAEANHSADLFFSTVDAGNGNVEATERMRIKSNGNVGVGTTNPDEKLHVVGNLKVVGSTTCTLGNGAGATMCSSDERLKTNVTPIENALQKIIHLKGVTFDWNENSLSPGSHSMGVIAQDVEKEFPTAVAVDNATGYKMVDYAVLVAPLIQAVKELYFKIVGQDSDIAILKKDNAAIKHEAETKGREITELKAYICGKDPAAPFCQ